MVIQTLAIVEGSNLDFFLNKKTKIFFMDELKILLTGGRETTVGERAETDSRRRARWHKGISLQCSAG